jgi:hypothetical protein
VNIHLTNPLQPPTAPAMDDQRIDRIANAFNQALNEATATPTAYKDPTPVPAIGSNPPVPQPGRPPMSQRATDTSAIILSAGLASLPVGAAATGILWASGHADPTVIGLICAAPIGLAVPILALSRLAKRAKETVEAAPAEIHQHYTGTVIQDQRSLNTTTRGIVAHTRNQIPR